MYLVVVDIISRINSRIYERQDKSQVAKRGHAIGRVTIFPTLRLRQKYYRLLLLFFPVKKILSNYFFIDSDCTNTVYSVL